MELQTFLSKLTDAKRQRLADLGFTPEEFVSEYNSHLSDYRLENPAVYCGTYGKYNGGSLYGQWIDLTTFTDYDEFINYCYALHADEQDPELMMQDFEYFPREWYDECLSRNDFKHIQEYIMLCEKHDRDAINAYINLTCGDNLDSFEEAYLGKWDSEEDFAEMLFNECYCDALQGLPSSMAHYIDYAAFARDIFMYDYDFEDGYVFRRVA